MSSLLSGYEHSEREGKLQATLPPPRFVRPKYTFNSATLCDDDDDVLTTLPDLVEFNALYNPRYTFCVQYLRDLHAAPLRVTYQHLHHAVLRCSVWLTHQGLAHLSAMFEGRPRKARPVALLMGSDVNWFIAFLALLRLGVPVSVRRTSCETTRF